jgi:hypothetical protein
MCLLHAVNPLSLGRLPRPFPKLLPRHCSDLKNQAGRSMMMFDSEAVLFNRGVTLMMLFRSWRSLLEGFPA